MRKNTILFVSILLILLIFSCETPTVPEIEKFPAPENVQVNYYTTAYGVTWNGVEGAISYNFYLKSENSPNYEKIEDYFEAEQNKIFIYWDKFKELSLYGIGPYKIAVQAISYDGRYSELAWSNTFYNLE